MLSVLLAQESVLVLGPDSPGSLALLVSSILLSIAIFKLWHMAVRKSSCALFSLNF